MWSQIRKALVFGFFLGVAGIGISLAPFGLDLEEDLGLSLLFRMRGVKQAPSDAVVVAIDRASAVALNLPDSPEKWPRSLHARLTENLKEAGAAVIAFDIVFDEERLPEDDRRFARAITAARNVVLCECVKKESVPITGQEVSYTGEVMIEQLVIPIPPLARSAAALAPFPLPKVPIRVSQCWTFRSEAGNMPTLPAVVNQVYSLDAYDDFVRLVAEVSPALKARLPADREALLQKRGVESVVSDIRGMFEVEPSLAGRLLQQLHDPTWAARGEKRIRTLESLISMYVGSHSLYLNFYGPSGTIRTVPYHKVLRMHEKSSESDASLDFRGKAVFVGLSDDLNPDRRDGFPTVFSKPSGVDISGVEIAATAFANLVERSALRPMTLPRIIAVVFFWGLVTGIFCRLSTTVISVLSALGLSVAYLAVTAYHFKTGNIWYPLIVPLFVQVPFALFGSILWRYLDANRERQNVRKALGYYLPQDMADRLSRDIADPSAHNQMLYGICLYTDAEHYTSLSETLDPENLGNLINEYYEVLFKPVKRHGGTVANVIGDAMLALWVTAEPDAALRRQACLAALDIAEAVRRFNHASDTFRLPTRIGLHAGRIFLGNVGAIDHYEYRPVGDIVNTATRLEGLNKYLGTQIAVSEEVLYECEGFLTRQLGKFCLAGKSKPQVVYELLGTFQSATEQQRRRCEVFADALSAFRRRSWEEAMEKFQDVSMMSGEDGPARFYAVLCDRYLSDPPDETWDGVVQLPGK